MPDTDGVQPSRVIKSNSTTAINKLSGAASVKGLRRPSIAVDTSVFQYGRHNSVSAVDLFGTFATAQRPFSQRFNSRSATETHGHNSSLLNLDNASLYSSDIEEQHRRMEVISSLRPNRLIGNFRPLSNWMDGYVEDVGDVKNKHLRKYYQDQNYLIERFTEIDNFLDAGKMHLKMLSTYDSPETQRAVLSSVLEEASDPLPEPHEEEPLLMKKSRRGDYDRSLRAGMADFGAVDLEQNVTSNNTVNSKSRIHAMPGNVTEGAHFLGYDEESSSRDILVAILVNFFVNFVLLIGKLVVSILTNSLSVVASLVDSILDFLSTFIIYVANRLTTSKNWKSEHAYPIGRSRLEPLGILVFSVIMIVSFFQVGQESMRRLLSTSSDQRQVVRIGSDAVAIMTLTIVSKVCCWLWCSRSKSSSVRALAQDAETDIVFNLVSLLMPVLGQWTDVWWLDPAGALVLSAYVIVTWARTAYEHIDNLTGAVASPLDYKAILYMAYRFAEPIKQITSLKAYHVGDNLNVEIDVVFSIEEMNLSFKDCHDLAEALQYALETMPMVERAFVHIDYMEGNFKGHIN